MSLITAINLLPVTSTPAINLPLVTRTPWGWGTAKDRRKLKGTNRRYLRPSKSYTASNGVIGKSPHTSWSETPEATKLNIFVLVWTKWHSKSSRQIAVYLLTAASSLLQRGLQICRKKRPLCQYSLLPKKKLSAVVLALANNLLPVLLIPFRNNKKAQNCSPVSTTLPINFLPVSLTPVIE